MKKTTTSAKKSSSSAKASRAKTVLNKLFVIDTNVLMHDPSCLYRFEEHDIYIPMMTLEEMDGHKSGMSEVSRNVRQATRSLDQILSSHPNGISEGVDLTLHSSGMATGKLFIQSEAIGESLPLVLPQGKGDNHILSVALALKKKFSGRKVILVSKDFNIRIKACALGLEAQDYLNDKSLEDGNLMHSGILNATGSFWPKSQRSLKSKVVGKDPIYEVAGKSIEGLEQNQFVSIKQDGFLGRVTDINAKSAVIKVVPDYTSEKVDISGIRAKNIEQSCAFDLLMDSDVDFVTLVGPAGTGKTLITLAAAIHQTVKQKRFEHIVVTRATIPVGEDIGFLPGDEEAKLGPWLGAIEDSLEVIENSSAEFSKPNAMGLVKSKIKIKSMSFMRGRSFSRTFLILDEAQNLTPRQMKTLITRAGPGTKIVCMGNLQQIDTPYLTEGGSGLTYAVEKFRGWKHSGHLILEDCIRSRLADYAGGVL